MRIERRYTKAEQSAYAGIEFRTTRSEIRNPDGSVVFKLDDIEVPAAWSQVASDILAQKYFRKAGVPGPPEEVRGERRPVVAVALGARRGGAGRPARGRALDLRTRCPPGLRPARRHLDLLGLEGRLFRRGGGRPRLLRRTALHARHPEGRAQLARSGSTPASTGPTASTGRARATTTSTTAPASSPPRRAPTSIRSRMPASSRASRTTSSTRAASWTCGSARRACSSTARAPAPTSPGCAAKASGCRAAASRPA